jgi:Peptidase S24-like
VPHGDQAFLSSVVDESQRERAIVELIELSLRTRAQIKLRAQGTSMIPAIWPGDILTVASAQSRFPEVGEVALIKVGKSVRAHRVVRAEHDGGLLTRGDALLHYDPYAARDNVLGTVIERNGKLLRRRADRWGAAASLRRLIYVGPIGLILARARTARLARARQYD